MVKPELEIPTANEASTMSDLYPKKRGRLRWIAKIPEVPFVGLCFIIGGVLGYTIGDVLSLQIHGTPDYSDYSLAGLVAGEFFSGLAAYHLHQAVSKRER